MSNEVDESVWAYQWGTFEDDNRMLFDAWISPATLEDFRDKTVLDAGCGGGHHLRFVAPYASEVVGVDLNCADIAEDKSREFSNITTMAGDIATMDLGRKFDVVYCIGVLHHTESPRASFKNLARHVRPGGRLIVWVYAHEGNALNRWLVEPFKRMIYGNWPRSVLLGLARLLTALLYLPVYSIYLLPFRFLPYYDYFRNFRRLDFKRNVLNVFDKLNAPRTAFIRREEVEEWFADGFTNTHISPFLGVSWRGSGTRSR